MKKVLLFIIAVLLVASIGVGIGYFLYDQKKEDEIQVESRLSTYGFQTHEYYENEDNQYYINSVTELSIFRNMYSDSLYDYLKENDELDDTFFKYHSLFILVKGVSSGSTTLAINDVYFENNKLQFETDWDTPEVGTMDMATWYLTAIITNDKLKGIDLSDWTKPSEINNVLPKENPIAYMTFEGYGDVVIELYPDKAFNTVANFVNLIEDKFYENNYITRVQKDFVLQAGGGKDLKFTIKGEFSSAGYDKNDLNHTYGVLSMARGNSNDSANGQFFIMLGDASYLDGNYAGFGKVIEGLDVLEKINNGKYNFADVDYNFLVKNSYIKITNTKVDTKGYIYSASRIPA